MIHSPKIVSACLMTLLVIYIVPASSADEKSTQLNAAINEIIKKINKNDSFQNISPCPMVKARDRITLTEWELATCESHAKSISASSVEFFKKPFLLWLNLAPKKGSLPDLKCKDIATALRLSLVEKNKKEEFIEYHGPVNLVDTSPIKRVQVLCWDGNVTSIYIRTDLAIANDSAEKKYISSTHPLSFYTKKRDVFYAIDDSLNNLCLSLGTFLSNANRDIIMKRVLPQKIEILRTKATELLRQHQSIAQQLDAYLDKKNFSLILESSVKECLKTGVGTSSTKLSERLRRMSDYSEILRLSDVMIEAFRDKDEIMKEKKSGK